MIRKFCDRCGIECKSLTDIKIPLEYYLDVLKRQAVVNDGLLFIFKNQVCSKFETYEFSYPNGIEDYVNELVGEKALTSKQVWHTERKGRDRDDKPEYKVKINAAVTFSNQVHLKEYYHNSSWLEHGGAP